MTRTTSLPVPNLLAVLLIASLPVAGLIAKQASAAGWDSSVLLKAGTLGAGPELDMRIPASPFGLRIDADGVGFSDDHIATAGFDYSSQAYAYDATMRLGGTARLLNGGLMADYYPFGHGLRLSAGVILNGNRVTADGAVDGTLRVGTVSHSGSLPGEAHASATFNFAAPVIGLGYTALLTQHLRVSLDAGAMYEGNPHLAYSLSGFPALPAIMADIERERERLQNQFNYPFYPVAMLGVGWRF